MCIPSETATKSPTGWDQRLADIIKLKHKEDLRSVGIVLTFFALATFRWNVPLPFPLGALITASIASFSFFGATITHNCVHVKQFRKVGAGDWMNSLWQVALTHTYGHPVSTLIPGHNLSHHKFTQGAKDVMRTDRMRYRYNLLNLILFVPSIVVAINLGDKGYFDDQKKKQSKISQQARFEAWCFYPVQALLVFLDWKKFLQVVFLPQLFGKICIITINLLQHDGCPSPEEQPYNHARNFVNSTLNYFTCNNGYHTIHHLKPGMHWTLLPEAHEKIVKPHIHKNLDVEGSILWYTFVTFVLPGNRQWFDGTPYKMPPQTPDIPWYDGTTTETYSAED
jgi:fatty acid desaturase